MPKHSKFRFPMPVYVATLASGEVVRISYGSPVGKPLDIARGRRCAAYQCGEDDLPTQVLHPVSCGRYDSAPLGFNVPDDLYPEGRWSPLTEDMRPWFDIAPGQWRPLPPKIPATIVKGHVEYNGEVFEDPMKEVVGFWPKGETPKKASAGPTPTEMRYALQRIVEMGNSPSPPPPNAIARYAAAVLGIEMMEAPKLRAVA